MWHRERVEEESRREAADRPVREAACRRAYYRVSGILPVRLTPLEPHEIEAAIFDLAIPDPLAQPIEEAGESIALMARLRRIEEKLDQLLGAAHVDVPRQLSGRDRQAVTFSGSGLSLNVSWSFRKGDAYRVEMLLPAPYSRPVRAVGLVVDDAPEPTDADTLRPLALDLRHMEPEDRDALVSFSYDLQRIALRARSDGGPET